MKNAGSPSAKNRREQPRFTAPIYCRTAPVAAAPRRPVLNISLGGIRIFSNAKPMVGSKMEIELTLPGDASLRCAARVAWSKPLPSGAEAKYDVGLQFLDVPAAPLKRMGEALQRYAAPLSETD